MRQSSSSPSSKRSGSRGGSSRRRRKSGGVYAFYSRLVAGCALAAVALLWVSAASVHVHPDRLGVLAWMGLMFPGFLAGVLCMLVFTLLFCRRRVWIPIVGLLGCCLTIRQYVPVNLPSPAPKQSLKLMSFNVMGYNPNEKDADGRTSVLRYLSRSGADIICTQEASLSVKLWKECHSTPFVRTLPYCDTVQITGPGGVNGLTIFSRFPIVGKRKLCSSSTNGAALFKVLIGKGDTLNVINCHFESNHLSAEERSAYRDMVHQPGRQEFKEGEEERFSIVRKFSQSAVERARQADSVARYVERHPDRSFVVCGDFNDTPVSYSRHRIAQVLYDAYEHTGNGIGRSFNRDAIYVRIDHLFVSPEWRVFSCHVDRSSGQLSDHYPITCHIKRRAALPE